jgi:hypothetical protein
VPWPAASRGFCDRPRRSQPQRPTPRPLGGSGAVLIRLPVRCLRDGTRRHRPRLGSGVGATYSATAPRAQAVTSGARLASISGASCSSAMRSARPGQTAGADGEIVHSVAERHALGAPADRARWAVLRMREMVACPTSRSVRYFSPPWAPRLGPGGPLLGHGVKPPRSAGAATRASSSARRAAPLTSVRSLIWRSSMPDGGVRACGWAKGCQ